MSSEVVVVATYMHSMDKPTLDLSNTIKLYFTAIDRKDVIKKDREREYMRKEGSYVFMKEILASLNYNRSILNELHHLLFKLSY